MLLLPNPHACSGGYYDLAHNAAASIDSSIIWHLSSVIPTSLHRAQQLLQRQKPKRARAQVPAVLLVCRNSTDTAYFQRLRPYPRVLLRRQNARFKARPLPLQEVVVFPQ